MKTYFISGIAADGRLFRRIRLPAGFDAVYLDWIKPQPNESLESYAGRLAKKINTEEPFVLMALLSEASWRQKLRLHIIPSLLLLLAACLLCLNYPDISK